jgi:hypothetical protein
MQYVLNASITPLKSNLYLTVVGAGGDNISTVEECLLRLNLQIRKP